MFFCCDPDLRPHPTTHLDGCAFATPLYGKHRAPGHAVTLVDGWDAYTPKHRGSRLAMQVI